MTLTMPPGDQLPEALVEAERAEKLRRLSRGWPSWMLTHWQLCDLELLLCGGFAPLRSFVGKADHASICARMRLADGKLWPIPVTLDLTDEDHREIRLEAPLALRDPDGTLLAVLHVQELWYPDRRAEAEAIFGTTDLSHPGVRRLLQETGRCAVSGPLEGIRFPAQWDFPELRRTPRQLRLELRSLGWERIVAFQTRNPMHRAHFELTLRAMREADARLLLHPVVGMTMPGDIDHYTRVRSYKALARHYPEGSTLLALLPLAMRMAGPREALWHALIRRNYGATHFIVGRDHASPGDDSSGRPFYEAYEAQGLVRAHEQELGITMIPFRRLVYVEERGGYLPEDEAPPGLTTHSISGTEQREALREDRVLPEWFTFPDVQRELRRAYLPRHRQGFTIFLTGLPSAGKSSIARALQARLLERGERAVTLLDGDLVRRYLSSELGFSREHRRLNIRRIGFVAAEVTKGGGVVICAAIAPYEDMRREVREMVASHGGFYLVHVATALEVCERRDPKGLYAKARSGQLQAFTGVSDPYEPPPDPELRLDAAVTSPEEAADRIVERLTADGYLVHATDGAEADHGPDGSS
jgi:sulfate adenylyltransferase